MVQCDRLLRAQSPSAPSVLRFPRSHRFPIMRRLPSIRTLETAFPGKGKELRQALEMTKAQLKQHPAGERRWRECYNPPSCYDLRLHVLDSIAETCGVEYIAHKDDTFHEVHGLEYLNTGETYTPTIVYDHSRKRYRVSSWGDIVERNTCYA
jgi:hypothetical protein